MISERNVFIIKRKKESMKFHMMKEYLGFRKRKWRLKKSNEFFFLNCLVPKISSESVTSA